MNTLPHLHRALAILASLVLATSRTFAGLVTEMAAYTPNLLIPDGSILGAADTRIFNSVITDITNVRVSLNLTGSPSAGDAFNGDLYAYLTHGSGFSVLLNRPGRTTLNDFGYADSGFNVTFNDALPGADIHNYQLIANPAGGALTGTWGSDGRDLHPAAVLDTTPRTALLTSFNGLDPNGAWTLFVADVSPLSTARLASWSLEVTGNSTIPEPATGVFGIFLTALALGARGKCAARLAPHRQPARGARG